MFFLEYIVLLYLSFPGGPCRPPWGPPTGPPSRRPLHQGVPMGTGLRLAGLAGLAWLALWLWFGWLFLGFGLISVGFRFDFGLGLIWLDSGLVWFWFCLILIGFGLISVGFALIWLSFIMIFVNLLWIGSPRTSSDPIGFLICNFCNFRNFS